MKMGTQNRPFARVYLEWILPIIEKVPDKAERCDIYENIFARCLINQTGKDVPFKPAGLSCGNALLFDVLKNDIDKSSRKHLQPKGTRPPMWFMLSNKECFDLSVSMADIGLWLLQDGFCLNVNALFEHANEIGFDHYPVMAAISFAAHKIQTAENGKFVAEFVAPFVEKDLYALEIYGYHINGKTCTFYGSRWAAECLNRNTQYTECKKAAFAAKHKLNEILIKNVQE